MTALGPVLAFEQRKVWRGVPTRVAAVAQLVLVLAVSVGGWAVAALGPGSQVGRKASDLVVGEGWPAFVGLAATAVGVTSLLAAGIGWAWAVGREFTDGAVVGLFALPVSTGDVATAKLLAGASWVAVVSAVDAAAVTVGGLLLGLPPAGALPAAGTVLVVGTLLGLSVTPVLWVATLGRGYLAGTAAALALVVITNLLAGFGAGGWVPWAIPVLWAMPGSGVPTTALALPAAVALGGAALTWRAWDRLQLGAA